MGQATLATDGVAETTVDGAVVAPAVAGLVPRRPSCAVLGQVVGTPTLLATSPVGIVAVHGTAGTPP